MPCESCKQALTDAAAVNEAPSREVAAHLNACPACRASFAEEQQLFAGIDSGVYAAANSNVPASLLPRVRARLDEQKLSKVSWIRVAALLASAALVLVSVLILERMRPTSREPVAPVNMIAASSAPKEFPTAVVPDAGPEKQTSEPVFTKWNRRRVLRTERAAESAVLVPASQREAVDNLLAALSKGTVRADDLLVQTSTSFSASGELAPLGIPEIEIKPLVAVSEDSAPTR